MKYRVQGSMTISVHVEVDADSEEEAMDLAKEAPLQTFCNQCARGEEDEWHTSGELDGEPQIEHVELID